MSLSLKVKVNPAVLIWARQESGMTPEDVFGKLNIESSTLAMWEANGEDIPFDTLRLIARVYKRQTAIFFLPETPPKTKRIRDCRNLSKNRSYFSPDTLLAIRRASRYLSISRDILDKPYWDHQYLWIQNFDGRSERVDDEVMRLRALLSASLDEQMKQKKPDEAFRYWRRKIENLGVFVFQFSMPEDELDGFSYAFNELPYGIVVNNKQASVRKIFTLFHELAHILKRNPGICRTDDSISSRGKAGVELECNSFAGKFLVPKENIKVVDSVDEIFELASLFNVSGEAYLRRMFDEKLIRSEIFFNLLLEVRKRSRSFIRQKSEGAPSMVIQSKSTRGNKFFGLVVDAVATNRMSFSTASDLLGLKPSNIH